MPHKDYLLYSMTKNLCTSLCSLENPIISHVRISTYVTTLFCYFHYLFKKMVSQILFKWTLIHIALKHIVFFTFIFNTKIKTINLILKKKVNMPVQGAQAMLKIIKLSPKNTPNSVVKINVLIS